MRATVRALFWSALAAVFCLVPTVDAHAVIGATVEFAPDQISTRQVSTLRIELSNTDAQEAAALTLSLTLPAGLTVAPLPRLTNTCSGSVAATPAGTTLGLSDGVITAGTAEGPGRCTVTIDVASASTGTFTATLVAGSVTSTRGALPISVGADLTSKPDDPIIGTKTFAPNIVHGNPTSEAGTSRVTIRLVNSNTFTVTGLTFTDFLPTGLLLARPPNADTSCKDASLNDPQPLASSITMTGGKLNGGERCTVAYDVFVDQNTSNTFHDEILTNTIPAGALTTNNADITNATISGHLRIQTGARIVKTFDPSTIASGDAATLTLEFRNYNASPLTSISMTDNLPDPMRIANPAHATTTCPSGTVSASPGNANFSFNNGQVPPAPAGPGFTSCTASVSVTVVTPSFLVLTNQTDPNVFGGVNVGPASAKLTVRPASNVTASKVFTGAAVQTGELTLIITLKNNATVPATNTSLTDHLTTMGVGYTVGSGPTVSTCGGTLVAPNGATTISLFNGTIPAGGTCDVVVPVRIGPNASLGERVNTIPAGAIDSSQGSTTSAVTASVNTVEALTVAKAFVPSAVVAGQASRVTITVTHTDGAAPFTSLSFSDNLPAGHEVALPPNVTNTCGGSVVAVAGNDEISLFGGSLGAGLTTCSVSVDVKSPGSVGVATNTLPANAVTTLQGATNRSSASATLVRIQASLTLDKDFAPDAIPNGGTSTMTVTIANPNALSITGGSLKDLLPPGIVIATPPAASFTGSGCTGTVTAVAGHQIVGLSGATLDPFGTCDLNVNVTAVRAGRMTNTIDPGTFRSDQGVTNADGGFADLDVTAATDLAITKVLLDPVATPGTLVTFKLTVTNAGPNDVSGAVVVDNDPPGVQFIEWTCSPSRGADCRALGFGDVFDTVEIPAGGSLNYFVTARLDPDLTGSLGNTASVTAPPSVTDPNPGNNTSTLTVPLVPSVDLRGAKSDLTGRYTPGARQTYFVVVTNAGPSDATSVNVSDTLPPGVTLVDNVRCLSLGQAQCGTVSGSAGGTAFGATGARIPADFPHALLFTVPVQYASSLATDPLVNTVTAVNVGPGAVGSSMTRSDSDQRNPEVNLDVDMSDGNATYAPGGSATYTVTVTGTGASDALAVIVNSALPAGVTLTGNVTCAAVGTATCGPVTGSAGGSSFGMAGATLPAGLANRLVLTVPVAFAAGLTTDPLTITATASDVSSGATAEGDDSNARVTDVVAANKSFTPDTVVTSQTSVLTVLLLNSSHDAATGTAFTDTLPAGVTIASPPNAASTCGGSVVAVPGGGSIALSGGTIPAQGVFSPGQCQVTVSVVSGVPGAHVNTLPSGAITSSRGTNAQPAQATLAVAAIAPIVGGKTIVPANLHGNGPPAIVTITLANDNPIPLTGVAFTDALPLSIAVANPANVANSCGAGVVSALPGATTVSLTGGTVAAFASCAITFSVVASSPSAHVDASRTNTIVTVTSAQGAAAPPFGAVVHLQTGAQVAKAFAPSTVANGGVATLTLTIRNLNATPLAPLDITDALPSGMTVASPAAAVTTCPGAVVTAPPGATSVSVSGGALGPAPAGVGTTECTVSVNVSVITTGLSPVTLTNLVAPGSFGGIGYGPTAAALVVTPFPAVSGAKAFSPSPAVQTQVSTLTITLSSAAAAPAVITSFTDQLTTMGPGFTVAAAPAAVTTCGGTVTAPPGGVTISMTGGAIPALGSCQIVVPVQVGATAPLGTRTNTIAAGDIRTTQGNSTTPITASLEVAPALTISKAFAPATVAAGAVTRLTLTLNHASGVPALSGVGLTDTLPPGHVVAPTPGVTSTCGGAVTAAPGSGSVTLAGGALAAGATSCQVSVNVTVPSGTAGSALNTIPAGAVTTAEGVTNSAPAAATIARTLAFLTLGKSFAPLTTAPGQTSRMTITIVNSSAGAVPLAGVSLTDVLPGGLVVANPPGASLTGDGCTGLVSAVVGGSTLSLTGGTIQAGSRCEIAADVTPNAAGNLVNVVPAGAVITAQGVTNPSQAVATLVSTGRADLRVQKTGSVPNVAPAGTITYTVTVSNLGPDSIVGASFADAQPTDATFTAWTCAAGAGATCTVAGAGAITDTVTIPTGSSVVYTITAAVTPAATGPLVNTATAHVPTMVVDPDVTNNSASIATPVTPPILRVSKTVTPASFVIGAPASYAITVVNTGQLPTTLATTVTDALPALVTPGAMPPGCGVASSTVTCTIPSGLAAEGSVTFVIPVTPTAAGQAVNTVTITGGGDLGCPVATERCVATVTNAVSAAQLRVVKHATPISFSVGVPASYTLTVINEGTLPTVDPVTVTDSIPASLAPGVLPAGCAALGQQVTCTRVLPIPAGAAVGFIIPVTPTASGSLVNTATIIGGDPSCPADAPARCESTIATAADAPQLRVTKQATASSFVVGAAAGFQLTVVNEGTAPTTAPTTVVDDVPDSFALGALPPDCTATLHRVTCTIAAGMSPGIAIGFLIPVTPSEAGTFIDTATADGGGDAGCPADIDRCAQTIATGVNRPQLRLRKEATPQTFTLNAAASYVLTVVNEGTAVTTAPTIVTDTLPGSFTPGTMPAGCVATGQQVTCTVPAGMSAGASTTFIIPVTPTLTGTFVNTATLTGGGDPGCPSLDPERCVSTIATGVDAPQLRVVKLASPSSFVVGVQSHYVILVVNQGGAATTAPATVIDNVPASLTLGTMPAGCVASGQQVTCTIPDPLAAGTSVGFAIPVTPTVAGESVVNTAVVSGGGDPGCPRIRARCESTVTTAVDAAQLRVTKSAAPPTFSVGVEGLYVLRVINEGTAATVIAARVTDKVPATFAIGTLPAACVATGQQVDCVIPAGLEPGEAATFAIPVTPASPGVFANSAGVSGGGDPGCPAAFRCKATILTAVGAPQLRIAKEATPPSFIVNVPGTYTLTVLNEGSVPTSADAVVADNIPATLTLGALPPGCAAVGHAVRCQIPAGLAPSAAASFVIPVTPTVTGILETNTATVSGGGDGGCEPAVTTRCEITITTAVDGPQLRLTKSLGVGLVVNTPATYTMSVLNEGSAATTAVALVVDNVPATFTLGLLPAGCAAIGQRVTCAIPAGLAPGATETFVIPVTPRLGGSYVNAARVLGGGDPGCPPAGRTRCESSIEMEVAGPRLRALKEAPASFVVGIPASYTIGIVNEGDAPASASATVTDDVPASLTLGALPAGCSAVGQVVTCTAAAGLAPDDTALFVIPVTATVGGVSLTNTARVSGGGDPGCASPGRPRCSATAVTAVETLELTMGKEAVPPAFTVGAPGTYVLTVTNQGTTATTVAATVTDDIPASLVPGTMPAGCGAAGNQVTCAIAPGLAPAAAVTFAIPVTPTAASPGVTNTASVSGGGDPGCPAAARCSSTVVTEVLSPVVIAPRLRVTKESSSRVGRPEVPFDYVITVTNEGTGPTTAVTTVSDDVPAVLTLGTLPPGCAAVGQAVTCTVAAGLEAGGQAVFVIPVTPTTAARLLINTAGVTGGGDPGCPAEPRCRSTIVMAGDIGPSGAVQLRLTKTASPLPFVPRHPATFTLTVINEGLTATSADATVVDPLPAETVLVDVPAGCSAVGQLVTCTVPAGLGAGASVSFVLSVTVDPSALGQTIRNQAAVAGGGDAGCPAEERCNAVLDVAVVAAIPLTSTVTFLAMAAALMVIALRRLRLRGRAARAR